MGSKMKRLVSILAITALLCACMPLFAYSVADDEKLLVLASEDFMAYQNMTDFDSISGGYGWDALWTTGNTGFLYNHNNNNYVYTNWGNGTRALAAPIPTNKDGVYYLKFTSFAQSKFKSGLKFGELIHIGTFHNSDRSAIYASVGSDPSISYTESNNIISTAGNTLYQYKAKITIKANGIDNINLKAYPASQPEPAGWIFADGVNVELGTEAISTIGYYAYDGDPNGGSTHFSNIVLSEVIEENTADISIPGSFLAVASEDWYEYGVGTSLRDYPTANESNPNGGVGWAGKWSPDETKFDANFTNGDPQISDQMGMSPYLNWGANMLSRRLATPLSLRVNSEIEIRNDLMAQQRGGAYVTLGNTLLEVGLIEDPDSADKNVFAVAKREPSGHVILPHGKGTVVSPGNDKYTMVTRIAVTPTGDATIKFKAYPYGTTEPDEWMMENIPYSFTVASLNYISLRGLMYHAYWGKIEIKEKPLTMSAKVGSQKGETNVYLNFTNFVPASDVNASSITSTGVACVVKPLYANSVSGVKTASGAVVSFTNHSANDINASVNVNIPSANISTTLPVLVLGIEPVSIEGIFEMPDDSTFILTLDLQGYSTKGSEQAVIIAAAYSDDNTMLGLGVHNKTSYIENDVQITINNIVVDQIAYVKVFGWDSYNSLTPACGEPLYIGDE